MSRLARPAHGRALLGIALALAAASSCDSPSATDPSDDGRNGTLSIAISPDSAEVFAGTSAQTYTATVRDAGGRVVTDAVVTWTSTAQAALAVTQGPATSARGVAGGRATITASTGAASTSATLVVKMGVAPSLGPSTLVIPTNGSLSQPAPGLLANAELGTPRAQIESFGGGVLGGSVTSFAAGQSASFEVPLSAAPGAAAGAPGTAQGSVALSADGGFSITPPAGFDGTLTFQFRVSNVAGSADGSVTVAVDGPPAILSTAPLDGAAGVRATSEIALTFSEAVTAPASAFRLECPSGTNVAFSSSGWGTDRVVLTPSGALPYGVSCLVTVTGSQVLDADSDDGPDAMAAGHSFAFTVESGTAPRASDDEYLVAAGSPMLVPAPGVIADDDFGVPAATITSFGGGSLGGSVTSHAPGTSAALPGGGTVRLNADGSLSVDTNGNTGELTFQYRLTNAAGTSDATVIVTAEDAPAIDLPPAVLSTTPGNGATGVAPTGPITVRFTEAVTIESGTFELECPVGPANARAFTLSGSGNADIVLTPTQPMPLGTTCRVIVNAAGVRDVDQFDPPNRPEEDYDFRFTIGTPPIPVGDSYFTALNTLLSVPAAGVLSGDALGTPAANVTSFGGGSLGGSVASYAAGTAVPFGGTGLAQLNANGSMSLTPPAGFVGTISFQYRLSNAAGTGDATVTVRVDAPPSVLTTTPGDGATGVSVATDLTVTFSEAVTLGASWIQANCTTSGTLTAADFAVTGGPDTFTLNPATDFAAGETCTFTVVPAQVTDTDSDDPPNQMAGNHVFSFSTQLPPSAVADSYLTVMNTVLDQGAPGVLSNDVTGVPSGTVVSFGGGSLGGSVTTHTAGTTAAFGGTGSVTVNADGSFSVTPPNGFSGNVTFLYRLSNASGSSDAQVTVLVQDAAPAILSTSPVNGATNVAANANLTATFTEPVLVAVPPTFQCTVSGTLTIADFIPSGGPTGFTLDPIVDFAPGETCTGVILASVVTDLDTDDPPDNMAADFVFSFTIEAAPAVDAAFDLVSSFAGQDVRNPLSPLSGGGAVPPSLSHDGRHGMSEQFSLTARATVPEHVLVQEIEGQSAILHLEANEYFGLDGVGTDIWRAATNGATVGEAIDYLSAVYEVEYERLKDDVLALLDRLRELGLVEMQ